MKIDPTGLSRAPFVRRERTAAVPGKFRATGTGDAQPAATTGAGLLAGVEGLFALQEIGDPLERRRRGLRHGHNLLDRLEKLRLGILTGEPSTEELGQLRQAASAGREQTEDPVLDDILGQIELRVAVELAKRGG